MIDKALNTNKNLFIESFDKELPSISQFPTILAAAISLFFKNYCDDKTEYKIGDVIQGYNGTRGKIIRKEYDNFIVAVPSDGTSRTLTAKQIRKNWIITNADLSNRKVKTKFTAYKELYSLLFQVESFPSEFNYKSAIILEKKEFDDEIKNQTYD